MSYIPDCRPKYKKDCEIHQMYQYKEPIDDNEINSYWYGLLNDVVEDKNFICGYDWCTNQAMCNLFDNLDIYESELEEVGIIVDDIDINIVNGAYGPDNNNINFNPEMNDLRELKSYYSYSDEELEKMTASTRQMLLIKTMLIEYIEQERDMLVTSMIEDMSEEEHQKAVNRAKEKIQD